MNPACIESCKISDYVSTLEKELKETKEFLYYHKVLNACYARDRQDMFRNNPSAIVQAHFKHSTAFLNKPKKEKNERRKHN